MGTQIRKTDMLLWVNHPVFYSSNSYFIFSIHSNDLITHTAYILDLYIQECLKKISWNHLIYICKLLSRNTFQVGVKLIFSQSFHILIHDIFFSESEFLVFPLHCELISRNNIGFLTNRAGRNKIPYHEGNYSSPSGEAARERIIPQVVRNLIPTQAIGQESYSYEF